MPPTRITRSIDFSCSLRQIRPDWSDERNQSVFGKAARLHGHNYRLEVTLEGQPDPVTGMVFDLGELKAILEREIMSRFDHRDLNRDTDFFEKEPATPENLVRVIHGLLVRALPDGLLARTTLHQDVDTSVEIVGPEA